MKHSKNGVTKKRKRTSVSALQSSGPRESSARSTKRGSAQTQLDKREVSGNIRNATVEQTSSQLMSDNASSGKVKFGKNGKSSSSSKREKSSKGKLKLPSVSKKKGDQITKKDSKKSNFADLSAEDIDKIRTRDGLVKLLKSKNIKVKSVLNELRYEEELIQLQVELVKLQRWAQKNGKRIAILFEGRDAAGKGGAIRRFTEHLNPRSMRVVALPKPSEIEQGQWYFQRYSIQLPSAGEIVFFDRSWYNRAVVEPVNGFCTDQEYDRFMQQVTEYEHMLYEDGITIIKFWFSISRAEQLERFTSRRVNPLKQWKLSPIDDKAQELWDKYSRYKELMFSRTHTSFSPWIIVQANNKKHARLESIRYVLSTIDYDSKASAKVDVFPDPNVVSRFHRNSANLD